MSDTVDPSTGTGAARKRGIEDVTGPAVVGGESDGGEGVGGGGGKNSKKRLTDAEREERLKEKEAREKEKAAKVRILLSFCSGGVVGSWICWFG